MPKFSRIKNNELRSMVRLPRLGKIRLGIKVKKAGTNTEYPKETDYFVVPPEVQAKYGEKPKELPVMLPTNDEEQILRQYYAVYGGNHALLCQGDGEQAERKEFTKAGGDLVPSGTTMLPCPGPETCAFSLEKGKNGKPGCKARTDFMVVLPEVSTGGVYQLSTGSVNSDVDIRSGLRMAQSVVGRIAWIPMVIRREERLIPDPDTGKMMTHWTVTLEHRVKLDEVALFKKDNDRVFLLAQQTQVAEPVVEGPESDTPVEIVADDPAASGTTAAAAVDADYSARARVGFLGDIQSATTLGGLQSIGEAIAKLADKLTQTDREILKTEFSMAGTALKQIQQQEMAAAGKGA